MEVAISLDDVGGTPEPSDLDARGEESADEAMLVVLDAPDGPAIQEDADPHAAPRRGRENGRDALAGQRVDGHLDVRGSGTQELKEGLVAVVRREDGGDRSAEVESLEVERGLTQAVGPQPFPIPRRVRVR